MVVSTVLHWLISQSLFLARITVLTRTGEEDPHNSISNVAYSCIPLLFVIILGSITVFVGLLTGFRKYNPGIPLAASCSAAISAACHPPKEDTNASDKPVMWGAVSKDEARVAHCCFTCLELTLPIEGRRYAGL